MRIEFVGTIWKPDDYSLPEGSAVWRAEEEVVGINYRLRAALAFVNGTDPTIEFQRDPKNSNDPNAINIIGTSEQRGKRISSHIGFVSKDVARLIAVYAEGMKLKPRLMVIWRGDNKLDYILIKFDILRFSECQDFSEQPTGADSGASKHYKPVDHQAAFDWWKSRALNSLFPYVCPSCGTLVPLRNRIVVSKRSCPKCSEGISLAKIDAILDISEADRRQKIQSGCGCAILLATAISVSTTFAAVFLAVLLA